MKALALGLLLSLWVMFGGATVASAHAIQTDYFVDLFASDLQIEFTATFSTGEPMAAADVLVYTPGDRDTPWATGQTDETGHYTFKPDPEIVGDWRIDFKQGGHEDIRIVPVDDRGIDYQNISHEGNRDFHLFAHVREGMALFSAATVGAAAVVLQRRFFRG